MLFADYADLRLTVLDTIRRNDLDVELRRFVLMAEEHLNHKIRHPDMMGGGTSIAITTGSGILPDDFLEFEAIYNAAGVRLKQLSKEAVKDARDNNLSYYVSGQNLIVGGSYSGTLSADYYAKIATLTGSATATNWLLQKYPRTYLYAICYEAMDFIDDPRAAKFEGQRDAEIKRVNIEGERKRFANAEISMGFVP